MAKAKSTFCTWYCSQCKAGNYLTRYNKKEQTDVLKAKKKFCPHCRKHTLHNRKDAK